MKNDISTIERGKSVSIDWNKVKLAAMGAIGRKDRPIVKRNRTAERKPAISSREIERFARTRKLSPEQQRYVLSLITRYKKTA